MALTAATRVPFWLCFPTSHPASSLQQSLPTHSTISLPVVCKAGLLYQEPFICLSLCDGYIDLTLEEVYGEMAVTDSRVVK